MTPTLSAAELAEYLLDLGGTLLSYGCPTHRLEALIGEISAAEGYKADAFAVPTGLWMTLTGPGTDAPVARMVRVQDWGVDLAKLAAVDRIFNDVLLRKLSLADARKRLDEVEAAGAPYPLPLRWAAAAGGSAASAVFFRGGWREIAVAAAGGFLLGIMRTWLSKTPRARLLQDFLGGLLAAGLAWAATAAQPGLSREVLVLSIVILLVPGMALTAGLDELSHKNLVSGASRLMEALMVFLSILFGIAAGFGLEQLLGLAPGAGGPPVTPPSESWALEIGAIVIASLCFGVLFSVPRRLLGTALFSGAIGWIVTGLGARYVPGSLAAFAAAVSVGLYANVVARATRRPAQIFLLPGLVLLVPGSFGFRSLEAFLRGEYVGGAARGFEMFLIGGAIVTGLLAANVLLPARKLL